MISNPNPGERPVATERDRRFLQRESVIWVRQGHISEGTRSELLSLYPEGPSAPAKLDAIAKATGAFFFGLALLLVNAHNWEHYSPWIRLTLVLALLGSFHAGTFFFERRGHGTMARVFAILAAISFGGGIALVGQAFNLESGSSAPFAVWACGVLPFAVLLNSFPLFLICGVLAGVWSCWNIERWGYLPGLMEQLGWLNLLVIGVLLLCAYATGRRSLLHIAIPLVVLAMFTPIIGWGAGVERFILPLICISAGVFTLISATHPSDSGFRLPWRTWAAWLAVWGFSFAGSSELHVSHAASFAIGDAPAYVPPMLVLGAAVFVAVRRARSAESRMIVVPAVIFLLTLGTLSSPVEGAAFLGILCANLAHLFLGFWLLRDGARSGRTGGYALGVFVLLVWAVARYIDFGKEFGMLGTAGMLALVGGALFVAARFWKNIRDERLEMHDSPVVLPAPAEALMVRFGAKKNLILTASASLAILTLLGMAVQASLPIWFGREVAMEVRPVDPRDLLRGEYVVLDFDACHPDLIDGAPLERRSNHKGVTPLPRTVYAVLAPDAAGVMKPVRWTAQKPGGAEVFIRGRVSEHRWAPSLRFGIEQFYVTEGRGMALERTRQDRRLVATLKVLDSGEARVVALVERAK